ncbi:hypothetical protein O6H91_05G062200 [Diphasiastrum complanatum]|uniref:Uncharacterized protein n=1 Tax=Diphasiastrum complanatum TaxID=34168 RepID=A0ACC2DNZ9_DIPCM|nr:hypothetical protein O6H91_05G062200 [Diphasiastrum complanatum]
MILSNQPSTAFGLIAEPHLLPASQLTAEDGAAVFAYINSTRSPVALLGAVSTILNVKPAPVMAKFSSQARYYRSRLNILAAFSEASSPTGLSFDNRVVKFHVLSGTSMSCPHIAGVVALLKALHPDWSPAAISSAIITTGFSLIRCH